MTIEDVLALTDEIKPNTYDDNVKIAWLSELDGKIFNEIILTHERDTEYDDEGNEIEPTTEFTAYESPTDELLVETPYADIYRNYLFAMIDYSNGESDRYTNSMLTFNASYKAFSDNYCRNHLAVSNPLKLF